MPDGSNVIAAPFGWLYGAGMRIRQGLYRRGVLSTSRIPAPVISIGNITTGGTGKTPLVIWLARKLNERGRRVCVLTRGYGRRQPSQRVVVSDGDKLLAGADDGGDEPRLIAEAVPNAAVVSDVNRASAAGWAIAALHSDTFILDDGFQHLKVDRDLDIVTIDASNPWGAGRVLPAGRLREPLAALERADCIVITRSELATDIAALRTEVNRLSGGRPIFLARFQTSGIDRLNPRVDDKQKFAEICLFAFCALGNPQAFYTHLRNDGFNIAATRSFRDHHVYTDRDLASLVEGAKAAGAEALITTAKDAVKLRSLQIALPCFVLNVELSIENERGLLGLVSTVIARSL